MKTIPIMYCTARFNSQGISRDTHSQGIEVNTHFIYFIKHIKINQECTNSTLQIAVANTLCELASITRGCSVWKFFKATRVVARILR